MTLFFWNSSLETGNARIDEQHRRLFALTNELAEAVRDVGAAYDVDHLVAELRDYAANHFCDEEKVMSCSSLSAAEQNRHRCIHRQFLEKVEAFVDRHAAGDANAITDCLDFLVDWLVLHILKLDQRIVRALPDAPVSGPPPSVARVLIGALVETERRFRQVSDEAPTMIWVCGQTGVRDFVNKAWQACVGFGAAEIAAGWRELVHPDDLGLYEAQLNRLLAEASTAAVEYRVRRSDGSWAWVLEHLSPRFKEGVFVGLVAAASDITPIKLSQMSLAEANRRLEREVELRTAQLKEMAETDPLTGVANRRRILHQIRRMTGEAGRREVVVLYADIDHFKSINDVHGHAVGDDVLVAVVDALRAGVRPGDPIGRVGGEEFVIGLRSGDLRDGVEVAERIRRSVESLTVDGFGGRVTLSIGVAASLAGETADTLIGRADAAMLTAKRTGRNRVQTALMSGAASGSLG